MYQTDSNKQLAEQSPGMMQVRWLIEALKSRGLVLEEILDKGPLDDTAKQRLQENYLSLRQYNELFEWAAKRLDTPCLGIQIAQSQMAGDSCQFGILGYLLDNSASLGECFDTFNRFQRVFASDFNAEFSLGVEVSQFTYTKPNTEPWEFPQDIDMTLGAFVSRIRRLLGEEWQPLRCSMTYAGPADPSEHIRFFGENISFNQTQNCLFFDSQIVEAQVEAADSILFDILKRQAEQIVDSLETRENLIGRVRYLVTAMIGKSEINLPMVASELCMSESSLRRKLAEQGTSFRELRENVILDTAKNSLLRSTESITTIALNLGFADVSSLTRLFRKRENLSPREYRKKVDPVNRSV